MTFYSLHVPRRHFQSVEIFCKNQKIEYSLADDPAALLFDSEKDRAEVSGFLGRLLRCEKSMVEDDT
jgi:hypothetical protein